MVQAEVTKSGKCRVRSPVWWVEYRDHRGRKCREGVSRDRKAAEYRMAQIVRDVERAKGGLPALGGAPIVSTFAPLADEYRQYLLDSGRCDQHAHEARRRVLLVASDCGWVTLADVTLAGWVRWVGQARGDGTGFCAQTINNYKQSLKAFFNWLVRDGRLPANPLAGAVALNVDADRRIVRRVLNAADFRKLIDTTRASPVSRVHLDGPSRAALYLLAARTGLRSATLAKLRPDDLRLDADVPHIPTEARNQKNRRAQLVPIPRAVVEELRPWLATRPRGELLWPGYWHAHRHASKMVAFDLTAAGIPVETADGQYDFHCLRSQMITDLALAGVPVQLVQQLAGHSTPALTSRYYTRPSLEALAEVVNKAADQMVPGLGSMKSKDPGTTPNSPRSRKPRKRPPGP